MSVQIWASQAVGIAAETGEKENVIRSRIQRGKKIVDALASTDGGKKENEAKETLFKSEQQDESATNPDGFALIKSGGADEEEEVPLCSKCREKLPNLEPKKVNLYNKNNCLTATAFHATVDHRQLKKGGSPCRIHSG